MSRVFAESDHMHRLERADGTATVELLDALTHGWCLAGTVPLALDAAERDPLVSAGRGPGDLVRALMDVPGQFWSRYPGLFARYQAVVRANASARRALPPDERLQFWMPFADVQQPAEPREAPHHDA